VNQLQVQLIQQVSPAPFRAASRLLVLRTQLVSRAAGRPTSQRDLHPLNRHRIPLVRLVSRRVLQLLSLPIIQRANQLPIQQIPLDNPVDIRPASPQSGRHLNRHQLLQIQLVSRRAIQPVDQVSIRAANQLPILQIPLDNPVAVRPASPQNIRRLSHRRLPRIQLASRRAIQPANQVSIRAASQRQTRPTRQHSPVAYRRANLLSLQLRSPRPVQLTQPVSLVVTQPANPVMSLPLSPLPVRQALQGSQLAGQQISQPRSLRALLVSLLVCQVVNHLQIQPTLPASLRPSHLESLQSGQLANLRRTPRVLPVSPAVIRPVNLPVARHLNHHRIPLSLLGNQRIIPQASHPVVQAASHPLIPATSRPVSLPRLLPARLVSPVAVRHRSRLPSLQTRPASQAPSLRVSPLLVLPIQQHSQAAILLDNRRTTLQPSPLQYHPEVPPANQHPARRIQLGNQVAYPLASQVIVLVVSRPRTQQILLGNPLAIRQGSRRSGRPRSHRQILRTPPVNRAASPPNNQRRLRPLNLPRIRRIRQASLPVIQQDSRLPIQQIPLGNQVAIRRVSPQSDRPRSRHQLPRIRPVSRQAIQPVNQVSIRAANQRQIRPTRQDSPAVDQQVSLRGVRRRSPLRILQIRLANRLVFQPVSPLTILLDSHLIIRPLSRPQYPRIPVASQVASLQGSLAIDQQVNRHQTRLRNLVGSHPRNQRIIRHRNLVRTHPASQLPPQRILLVDPVLCQAGNQAVCLLVSPRANRQVDPLLNRRRLLRPLHLEDQQRARADSHPVNPLVSLLHSPPRSLRQLLLLHPRRTQPRVLLPPRRASQQRLRHQRQAQSQPRHRQHLHPLSLRQTLRRIRLFKPEAISGILSHPTENCIF
jgi:hypothetical protein